MLWVRSVNNYSEDFLIADPNSIRRMDGSQTPNSVVSMGDFTTTTLESAVQQIKSHYRMDVDECTRRIAVDLLKVLHPLSLMVLVGPRLQSPPRDNAVSGNC